MYVGTSCTGKDILPLLLWARTTSTSFWKLAIQSPISYMDKEGNKAHGLLKHTPAHTWVVTAIAYGDQCYCKWRSDDVTLTALCSVTHVVRMGYLQMLLRQSGNRVCKASLQYFIMIQPLVAIFSVTKQNMGLHNDSTQLHVLPM